MYEPQWHPKCPRNQKAATICLSHNCPQTPFQCNMSQCPCNSVHLRCKVMQWKLENNICKEGIQFMTRIEKIFSNLKGRIERQEKIFQDYCKDNFLGKDYSQLMFLMEQKEQKNITTSLVSSALRNLTEPIKPKTFSNFTISQMQSIDKAADHLFTTLDKLYHSKEQQKVSVDRIRRTNSAVLERSTKYGLKSTVDHDFGTKSFINDMVTMKLDLTFPKNIDSKIVSESTSLNKLLNRKVKKYHLAYRASESSFSIQHFYHKMQVIRQNLIDSAVKGHKNIELMSLILVKNQYGKVVGGFTPLLWEEPKGQEESDDEELNPEFAGSKSRKGSKFKSDTRAKTSFFSLDLMQRYELKKPEEAIYCGRKSIGFGKGDFKILDKGQLLRKNSCKFPVSYNYTPRPYSNWSKSGMELSGSRYSVLFKLAEWEAFLVQF